MGGLVGEAEEVSGDCRWQAPGQVQQCGFSVVAGLHAQTLEPVGDGAG
ncbi:hypothetical protein [Fodinicola feengrottensis]|nr:hypothetical protein [Fodinicola feengrottensis]